ncbi:MAG: AbrB/MazE/SpoVT family DNA-binding domain-containing protein [Thermoplasmata archaeon]|nr:AbrB/MazE/SpoVT family DNA-binding domain-containing protein [Thermoplasmata archaeon]MCI4356078.1 AbrB/MazE/SpoVT family DNA-binding domain-containing protein [Thermoplasmata archaeon]
MTNGGRPAPFVSHAVKAARRSESLRVTIPQVVATTLGLHAGDELRWFLEPQSGSVRVEARARRTE